MQANNNILLTIIIPAYNMEKLLHRCLDSIIVESVMDKVQVIVVNDGSKDKTSEIAHEYEEKYPSYFQVVDKENGNYGSCMNVGLTLAKGKYFRTLDADDWYDKEAYLKFVMLLGETDADLIITDRFTYYEDKKMMEYKGLGDIKEGEDLKVEDAFEDLSKINKCLNVQHFTYKTEIIKKSNLKWIEGIYYTDAMYNVWPLPLVDKVRFAHLPVYVYLRGINEQSMSPMNIRKHHADFVTVAKSMLAYFKKYYNEQAPYFLEFRHIMDGILRFVYADLIINSNNLNAIQEVHSLLDDIPSYKQYQINKTNFQGIHYIKNLDKGVLPLSFLLLRTYYNFKISVWNLLHNR